MEKKELRKSGRKSLRTIQVTATDKENLTRKLAPKKSTMNSAKTIQMKKSQKKKEEKSNNITAIKNNINENKTAQNNTTNKITTEDLTNDNPSDNYWKQLAETHKAALDIALKEKMELHNKVNELEYENTQLKSMLDEAKSLVETLTEMLEEKEEENESGDLNDETPTNKVKNSNLGNVSNDSTSSDSDVEDMSFQSCVQ